MLENMTSGGNAGVCRPKRVISMMRQTGLAIGVAVFVAVLATPTGPAEQLAAFHRGWWVLAAIAALATLPAVAYLRRPTS